jgi:hypothetical protein
MHTTRERNDTEMVKMSDYKDSKYENNDTEMDIVNDKS